MILIDSITMNNTTSIVDVIGYNLFRYDLVSTIAIEILNNDPAIGKNAREQLSILIYGF